MTPAPEPAGTFRSGGRPGGFSHARGRGRSRAHDTLSDRRRRQRVVRPRPVRVRSMSRDAVRRGPDRPRPGRRRRPRGLGATDGSGPRRQPPRAWSGCTPTAATRCSTGVDPVASEDPMAFLPYEREIAAAGPRVSTDNAYPYAAQRILSLFADADRSPDVAVVHTPRHWFPDEGGHAGEHGSLDVIQSRAPLVMSGPGVRAARLRRRPRPPRRRRPRPWPCWPGCPSADLRRRATVRRSTVGPLTAYLEAAARRAATPGGRASSGTARTAATCCTWPRPASCPASPG